MQAINIKLLSTDLAYRQDDTKTGNVRNQEIFNNNNIFFWNTTKNL